MKTIGLGHFDMKKKVRIQKSKVGWRRVHEVIEALRLHTCDWRRIKGHMGMKTAVQIRTQNYSTKVDHLFSLIPYVYLSIPQNMFIDAVKCASSSASSANGRTRVIVEKPFGRDFESFAALTRSLKQSLDEDQIFR